MRIVCRMLPLFALALVLVTSGCRSLRVPAFDPTGQSIFSGQTTAVVHEPGAALPTPAFPNPATPPPCGPQGCGKPAHPFGRHCDVGPANQLGDQSYVVLTPGRVVAPVGSEVIVVAGICGEDGYFVKRQQLEWMMSPDSVGHIMQVGNNRWCFLTDWISARDAQKLDLDWAKNRTHTHRQTVDRGTPALNDDVVLGRGQSWVSVMSPTEGASYVTVMAPNEENWDRRRQTATIYWVDAVWTLPPPQIVRVDRREAAVLTTTLMRSQGAGPIENWLVRYEVVGGPAALFDNGAASIEVPSDINGQANVRLIPQSTEPGITQVAIQIVRPPSTNTPRMVVGQGLTSVTWSAPGLAVRATGPATANADQPITYRVEVSNTGDIPAPNVVLAYALPEGSTLVGTNPPAQPFGNRLEWRLGDLPPRSQPQAVEVTVAMRLQARYDHRFRATSMKGDVPSPELQAEAVASTVVNRSALSVRMRGPQTVPVGGQATFLVEVENTSSLPATNIMLQDVFDAGLQHVSGQASPLTASIGTLGPGEKQGIALNFIVTQPGTHCHRLDVTADGGIKVSAQECVTATGEAAPAVPRATVRMTGRDRLGIGERGQFEVEVRNTGTVPLTGVRVGIAPSASTRLTQASQGYQLARGEVYWELAELPVGEGLRWQIEVQGMRSDPGARSIATVTSAQGLIERAEIVTQVIGEAGEGAITPIPDLGTTRPQTPDTPETTQGALRVDVVESADPAVVGQPLTYRITVANESREPDQRVGTVIELPDGLRFESITGGAEVTRGRIVPVPIAEVRGRETLRPVELRVVPEKPGRYTLRVLVRSTRVPEGVTSTQETTVVAE